MNISKLIPFKFKIKSLYWVRKEKEINSDLTELFNKIDNDDYNSASVLLDNLRNKWVIDVSTPEWFQLEYIAQFSKADAMISFLTANESIYFNIK